MADDLLPTADDPGRVIVGHAMESLRRLPAGCLHCVATSPPYWSLRDYKTSPQVWGGDSGCQHRWSDSKKTHRAVRHGKGGTTLTGSRKTYASVPVVSDVSGQFCSCGAWRGELGQEPTPALYVEHLVELFREVRRVLHPSGVLWLNLGDSYSSGGRGTRDPGQSKIHPAFTGEHNSTTRNRPDTPPGLKPKDLICVPWRAAMALQADGWYLRAGCPWIKRNCLSGGTVLYVKCQKGVMPMTVKDLARLKPSTVQLWNGRRWTQMVDMWRTPEPSGCVELRMRSGEKIGCTPNHRWPTARGLLYASELRVGDQIEAATLPDSDQPEPDLIPDDIGYLVGLFIAEGCRVDGGGLRFTLNAAEGHLEDAIRSAAGRYGASCRTHVYGNVMHVIAHGRAVEGVINSFVAGDGSDRKHLANACWQRSNRFLRALLDGYLAGDGHWDAGNLRWRLGFCCNDAWAADLRTLAGRLGHSLRLNRAKLVSSDGKKFPGWRGQIRFDPPKETPPGGFERKADNEIVSVEASRARQFWDIEVADEPHLFALASGLLTHNSMPSSVTDRPASSLEYVFLLSKSERYFYDYTAVRLADSGQVGAAANFKRSTKEDLQPGQSATQHRDDRKPTHASGSRNRRDTDWFFDSWQGIYPDDDGDPLAFVVNPVPSDFQHFAQWPPLLVEPMIRAGSSEKGVCPACLAPWGRVVERERKPTRPGEAVKYLPKSDGDADTAAQLGWNRPNVIGNRDPQRHCTEFRTAGWLPSCECDAGEPIPSLVGDIFCGTGTTIAAAVKLKRRGLGLELNPDYAAQAEKRLAEPLGVGGLFASETPVVVDLFGNG